MQSDNKQNKVSKNSHTKNKEKNIDFKDQKVDN